jgi:hypothetical protein
VGEPAHGVGSDHTKQPEGTQHDEYVQSIVFPFSQETVLSACAASEINSDVFSHKSYYTAQSSVVCSLGYANRILVCVSKLGSKFLHLLHPRFVK